MVDFYCPADGAICHIDHKTGRKIMSKNDTSWDCESCGYYPPSSCDGKPCSVYEPDDPFLNCYEKKEHENEVKK